MLFAAIVAAVYWFKSFLSELIYIAALPKKK